MVARYLNNDKKGEKQIRETDTGYKVRQTMNHIYAARQRQVSNQILVTVRPSVSL